MSTRQKILIGFIALAIIFSFASVVFAGGKQETKGTAALPIKTTSMDNLIAKAKKEGVLVSYGLPDDWVNYGGIMKIMLDKYGIKDMDTDMGSGTIISTLKSEKMPL